MLVDADAKMFAVRLAAVDADMTGQDRLCVGRQVGGEDADRSSSLARSLCALSTPTHHLPRRFAL